MSGFTEQQHEALEKAWDILTEHFDGCVLGVLSECGDNEPQEATKGYWHGGRIMAIGLVEDLKHYMLKVQADEIEP